MAYNFWYSNSIFSSNIIYEEIHSPITPRSPLYTVSKGGTAFEKSRKVFSKIVEYFSSDDLIKTGLTLN